MTARRAERAELEGFAAGLRLQLDRLGQDGQPSIEGERLWSEARAHLTDGRLTEAQGIFLQLDRSLAAAQQPQEMTDRPRGLIAYRPRGTVGVPPPREEEPVANRLLLVQRLWEIRRSQGRPVEGLLPQLHAAEQAYQAGDRQRTRQLVDEVLSALETMNGA
ncbi:MAG: hypothetical protein WB778_05525 [Thermoplasmata archaeon]